MDSFEQEIGLKVLVSLCKRYEKVLGDKYTYQTCVWYHAEGIEKFFETCLYLNAAAAPPTDIYSAASKQDNLTNRQDNSCSKHQSDTNHNSGKLVKQTDCIEEIDSSLQNKKDRIKTEDMDNDECEEFYDKNVCLAGESIAEGPASTPQIYSHKADCLEMLTHMSDKQREKCNSDVGENTELDVTVRDLKHEPETTHTAHAHSKYALLTGKKVGKDSSTFYDSKRSIFSKRKRKQIHPRRKPNSLKVVLKKRVCHKKGWYQQIHNQQDKNKKTLNVKNQNGKSDRVQVFSENSNPEQTIWSCSQTNYSESVSSEIGANIRKPSKNTSSSFNINPTKVIIVPRPDQIKRKWSYQKINTNTVHTIAKASDELVNNADTNGSYTADSCDDDFTGRLVIDCDLDDDKTIPGTASQGNEDKGNISKAQRLTVNHRHNQPADQKPRYACHLCEKTFSRRQILFRHYKTHPEGEFVCKKCGKLMSSQTDLDTHAQEHTNSRSVRGWNVKNQDGTNTLCKGLDRGFTLSKGQDGTNLTSMVQDGIKVLSKDQDGTCTALNALDVTDTLSKDQDKTNAITDDHNMSNTLSSDQDETKQLSKGHDGRCHDRTSTLFKEEYGTDVLLTSHDETNTLSKDTEGTNPLPVGLMARQQQQQNEEEVFETSTDDIPCACSVCRVSFGSNKALKKHYKTYNHCMKAGTPHTGRKYLCQDCGKAYFKKHALQRHMRCHTGDRQHMCKYCEYRCMEANNLKRHMALHFEAKRNFICEVCGAAFHAKKTLESHSQYKHTSDRHFKCSHCPLAFKGKSALKRHEKIHTLEKKHTCFCGSGFHRVCNLRRHLRLVHGNNNYLPPVNHVELLDFHKKVPLSKTDMADQFGSSATTKYEKSQNMHEDRSEYSGILHMEPSQSTECSGILHMEPSQSTECSGILHMEPSQSTECSGILHMEPSQSTEIVQHSDCGQSTGIEQHTELAQYSQMMQDTEHSQAIGIVQLTEHSQSTGIQKHTEHSQQSTMEDSYRVELHELPEEETRYQQQALDLHVPDKTCIQDYAEEDVGSDNTGYNRLQPVDNMHASTSNHNDIPQTNREMFYGNFYFPPYSSEQPIEQPTPILPHINMLQNQNLKDNLHLSLNKPSTKFPIPLGNPWQRFVHNDFDSGYKEMESNIKFPNPYMESPFIVAQRLVNQDQRSTVQNDIYTRFAQEELNQRYLQESHRLDGLVSPVKLESESSYTLYPYRSVCSSNTGQYEQDNKASLHTDTTEDRKYLQSRHEMAAESLAQMAALAMDGNFQYPSTSHKNQML